MSRLVRHSIVAFASAAIIASASIASAAPQREAARHIGWSGSWHEQISFVSQIWGSLKALWGENGTSIDPDGAPHSVSPAACVPQSSLVPAGTSAASAGTCVSAL